MTGIVPCGRRKTSPLTQYMYTPSKKITTYFAFLRNHGIREIFILFLGETPRNKPGRRNRQREISRCFSVKFLGVSPRKVITWIYRSNSFSRSFSEEFKRQVHVYNFLINIKQLIKEK